MVSPEHATHFQSGQTTRAGAPSRFTCQPDLLCDRFRIVRLIAWGGMGEVYEAEDLELSERVALKTWPRSCRPPLGRQRRR